jgi:hypothetical protein
MKKLSVVGEAFQTEEKNIGGIEGRWLRARGARLRRGDGTAKTILGPMQPTHLDLY